MIIIETESEIILKDTIDDIAHVRLVPGKAWFFDEDCGRDLPLSKPPAEYSVNELRDMLDFNNDRAERPSL